MVDIITLNYSLVKVHVKKRISYIVCDNQFLFKSLTFPELGDWMSETGQDNHVCISAFR